MTRTKCIYQNTFNHLKEVSPKNLNKNTEKTSRSKKPVEQEIIYHFRCIVYLIFSTVSFCSMSKKKCRESATDIVQN